MWGEGRESVRPARGGTDEEINERQRVKEKGRLGRMDLFLAQLQSGELDELSLDQKCESSHSSEAKASADAWLQMPLTSHVFSTKA